MNFAFPKQFLQRGDIAVVLATIICSHSISSEYVAKQVKCHCYLLKMFLNSHLVPASVLTPLSPPLVSYALVASFLTKEDLTGVEEIGETSSQVWAMSCSRRRPCQIVFTPGSPSPLRPKKPPSWAIQRTQVFKLGDDRGGCGVL